MEIDDFLLVGQVSHVGSLLGLKEDGAEVGIVALEENVELVEGGHSVHETLLQNAVGLLAVLEAFLVGVDHIQLVGGLSIPYLR